MPRNKPLADPNIVHELEGEDLPSLSPNDLIFLGNLLAGETLLVCYNTSRPASNMTDNAKWVAASRLKNSTNMQRWVSAAKTAGAMRAACTVESHLIELDRLKELAIQSGNMGAATRCEELRAKAAGLYIAKDPNLRNQDNDMETIAEGLRVFGLATAQTMARELGYHPSQVPCLAQFVEKTIEHSS